MNPFCSPSIENPFIETLSIRQSFYTNETFKEHDGHFLNLIDNKTMCYKLHTYKHCTIKKNNLTLIQSIEFFFIIFNYIKLFMAIGPFCSVI